MEESTQVSLFVHLNKKVSERKMLQHVADKLKVLIGALTLEVEHIELCGDANSSRECHVYRVMEQADAGFVLELEGHFEHLIEELALASPCVANANEVTFWRFCTQAFVRSR